MLDRECLFHDNLPLLPGAAIESRNDSLESGWKLGDLDCDHDYKAIDRNKRVHCAQNNKGESVLDGVKLQLRVGPCETLPAVPASQGCNFPTSSNQTPKRYGFNHAISAIRQPRECFDYSNYFQPGRRSARWNARNGTGTRLPSFLQRMLNQIEMVIAGTLFNGKETRSNVQCLC